MARTTRAVAAILLGLTATGSALAAVWQTGDGLGITLADETGRIERVAVGERELALPAGVPGGLTYREFTCDPDAPPRTVLAIDAEGAEQTWTQASFADWEAAGEYVRRATGDAPAGEAYLQLGNGRDAGVGMAAAGTMPMPPGGTCAISWQARTHKTDLTYILCMRVFDEQGRDITESTAAPPGWTWSPYSRAHYRCDLGNTQADTWERISSDYAIGEEVAAGRLSLRVYTGGDLWADIDDLQVEVTSGQWSDETSVIGRVEATADGLLHRAEDRAAGLAFETRYFQEAGQLRMTVEVSATSPERASRCLRMRYRLPLALEGWTWADDPRRDQTIAPGERYENSFGLAGHRISRYPLVSVSHGEVGLAMAVALDQPALQTFAADAHGLFTSVDLGLSPHAPRARARFALTIYRHDPAWTFRAALERYYALLPGLFTPAAPRGGAWTLRIPRPEHAAPEDFGIAFYECGVLKAEMRDYCRAHGILTFPYSEPWGRRQNLGDAASSADLPPYSERLAFLRSLAEQKVDGKKWGEAPRDEMARAVLNSLITGPDGQAAYLVDFYSSWAQWWQLNTDPDLPEPSMASVSRRYEIDPLLEWADGIYLDSVSPYFGRFEDHAPEHLAASDLPLAFSLRTGTPVVLSGFSAYEFTERLYRDLHGQGKLLMMNLFPPATRLYGHLGDVVGSELLGLQEDEEAMQQRIYACRRPVSNLMQWRSAVRVRVPAMTPEEMEDFIANQLLYGFWPGVSTVGGGTEPGYAHMHRYFEDPELLARDRPLFAEYLPLFDALNEAGWEPVTHVRSATPSVRIERYGTGAGILLAVANTGAEPQEATLTLDRDWWEQTLGRSGEIVFQSERTEETFRAEANGQDLTCRVSLAPRRTLVLQPRQG